MGNTKRLRFPRYTLRTLFVVVVLLALPLAWITNERRRSRNEHLIANQLREIGFDGIRFGGPYDDYDVWNQGKQQSRWRIWAERALGQRMLNVVAIENCSDLTPISGLKNLQHLTIILTPITDLSPVAHLTEVRYLSIRATPVSDLRPVSQMINLQMLDLEETKVEDLSPLKGLANLRRIRISRSPISKEQSAALKTALPHCEIELLP